MVGKKTAQIFRTSKNSLPCTLIKPAERLIFFCPGWRPCRGIGAGRRQACSRRRRAALSLPPPSRAHPGLPASTRSDSSHHEFSQPLPVLPAIGSRRLRSRQGRTPWLQFSVAADSSLSVDSLRAMIVVHVIRRTFADHEVTWTPWELEWCEPCG
jgi:hypothetical protein